MTLYKFLEVFSLDTKVKLYNARWAVIYEGPIKRIPAEYILESYYVIKSYIDEYSTLEVAIELGGGTRKMTIENARKAGELSKKLKYVIDALHTAKDARTYAFRHGVSFEVRFGVCSVEMVPVDIAEEALDMIIKRLAERCDKITAEIEAL